jgi:hypothetical protein
MKNTTLRTFAKMSSALVNYHFDEDDERTVTVSNPTLGVMSSKNGNKREPGGRGWDGHYGIGTGMTRWG